jgi:hypothetical protein
VFTHKCATYEFGESLESNDAATPILATEAKLKLKVLSIRNKVTGDKKKYSLPLFGHRMPSYQREHLNNELNAFMTSFNKHY